MGATPQITAEKVFAGIATGGIHTLVDQGVVQPMRRKERELKEQGERAQQQQQQAAAAMAQQLRERPRQVAAQSIPDSARRRRLLQMGMASTMKTGGAGLGSAPATASGDKKLLGQ